MAVSGVPSLGLTALDCDAARSNDPLLRPIRKVVPPIGGLDLSVLVAVVLLQIALYLLRMVVPV